MRAERRGNLEFVETADLSARSTIIIIIISSSSSSSSRQSPVPYPMHVILVMIPSNQHPHAPLLLYSALSIDLSIEKHDGKSMCGDNDLSPAQCN